MFCQKCGNEVLDEAVVCTRCGCALNKVSLPSSVEDTVSIGLLILSIVIPIVGVLLWPIKHKSTPKAAKVYGLAGIAAWICYFLFIL